MRDYLRLKRYIPKLSIAQRTLGRRHSFILNRNGVLQITKPQSLVQIYVHLVFSTKDRTAFLRDKTLREQLYAYLTGACRNQDCPSLQIGGIDDHVHLLVRLGKSIDIATLIRELKRESSKWIKTESPSLGQFHWQSGYGAFSISPTHVQPLIEYITNQEEHHRQESFQVEFRRLCQRNGIEIDERYVWD